MIRDLLAHPWRTLGEVFGIALFWAAIVGLAILAKGFGL